MTFTRIEPLVRWVLMEYMADVLICESHKFLTLHHFWFNVSDRYPSSHLSFIVAVVCNAREHIFVELMPGSLTKLCGINEITQKFATPLRLGNLTFHIFCAGC
jgi:hypothetical protein